MACANIIPLPGQLTPNPPGTACGFQVALSGPNVAISNGGLTATGGNASSAQLAKTCPAPPGVYYVELTVTTNTPLDNSGFGVSLNGSTAASVAANWSNAGGYYTNDGSAYANGSGTLLGIPSVTQNTVVPLVIDTINGYLWIANLGTLSAGAPPVWNNALAISTPSLTGSSPANWINPFGVRITDQPTLANVTSQLTLLFRASTVDSFTLNNGGSSFTYPVPAGAQVGWNGALSTAYSALDPATAVNVSFGNANFGLTAPNTIPAGARSHGTLSSGKRYWQFTVYELGDNSAWAGLCDSTQTIGAAPTSHSFACWGAFSPYGQLYNGTVGEIAIDAGNALGWIRGRNSDNWNGNALADPASGAHGVSLSGLTPPYYFGFGRVGAMMAVFMSNPNSFNSNYTIPAGFTGGFPA